MNNEILNVLNVGAPIFRNVTITFDELMSICDNKEKLQEKLIMANFYFNKECHYTRGIAFHRIENFNLGNAEIGKIEKDFINSFIVSTSCEDSKTYLHLDPTNHFIELQKVLNVDDISDNMNDNSAFQKLVDRLVILKNITSLKELEEKFPELYKDYLNGNDLYSFIERAEDDSLKKSLTQKYYRCGLRVVVGRFIEKQFEIYKSLIANYKSIINICYNKKDCYKYLVDINPDKLQLLIAYKYLNEAKNTGEISAFQDSIFYILPTILNNNLLNTSIVVDDVIINREYLSNEYKSIMDNKANFVPYTTNREKFVGKTKEESLEMLDKELDLMKTIKKEKNNRIYLPKKSTQNNFRRNPIEKNEKELIDLYERKIALLETDRYIEKFTTQLGYDWYLYFLYENGNILRERYFKDSSKLILAGKEAMYKCDIYKHDEYHDLNKRSLIYTPSIEIARIYHAGNYEKRATEYMDEPTNEFITKDAEDFIIRQRKIGNLVPTKNNKVF